MENVQCVLACAVASWHQVKACKLGARPETLTFALGALVAFGCVYSACLHHDAASKRSVNVPFTGKVAAALLVGDAILGPRVSIPNRAGITGMGFGAVSALFLRATENAY